MAQFNADILFNADVRKALKGIDRLEGGIRSVIIEVEKFEATFKRIAQGPTSRFQLEQQRKLAGAISEQNKALAEQITLASQLGNAYDNTARKAAEFARVTRSIAEFRQKALPGGFVGQKALPAKTSGKPIALQREQDAAIAAEANLRKELAEEAAKQLRVDKAITEAKLKLERAAEGEVSNTVRTGQKIVPRGTGNTQSFLQQPGTGSSRYQQQLQREVDRQLVETGKLSKEIRETVDSYNKVQKSNDRLIKTTGRLSTTLRSQAGGGGRRRRRRGQGGLGAAVGFPLLFGGGPGSVLGGAIGTLGGFDGQILGSAIGQQLDNFTRKTADLGKALNAATADIDTVIDAAGKSGTDTEKLAKKLQKLGEEEAALEFVTAQLALAIGDNGVNALKQFGDEASELGNTFSVTISQLASALAEFINKTGILRSIINELDFDNDLRAGLANTSDSELLRLQAERQNFIDSQGGAYYEEDIRPYKERIVLRQRELELQEEQFSLLVAGNRLSKAGRLDNLNRLKQAESIAESITQLQDKQAEKQENFEQQRANLVKQNEKQIAQLRISIEEQVSQIRLNNLRKQAQLLDTQADIRKQSLANQLSGLGSGFSTTEAAQAADAVKQFLSTELSVQEQIAKLKRDTALEIKALELRTEQLKLRVARQVAEINESSAERIAELNKQVQKANEQASKNNFDRDKEAALLNLKVLEKEARAFAIFLAAQGVREAVLDRLLRELGEVQAFIKQVENTENPALTPIPEIEGVGAASVDTTAVERELEASKELVRNLGAAKDTLLGLASEGNYSTFIQTFNQIFDSPLNNLREDVDAFFAGIESGATVARTKVDALIQKTEDELDKLLIKLEGLPQTPARDIAIGQVRDAKNKVGGNITETSQLTLQRDLLADLTKQREKLENATKNYNTVQRVTNELTAAGIPLDSKKAKAILEQARAVDQLTAAEKQRQEIEKLTKEISGTLVNGLVDGLQLAITETERLGEAMRDLASDILLAIGRALILSAIKSGINALANNAGEPNGGIGLFSILSKGFAEGGYVTGPTPALVGEGGEPEYIIPQSKMSGAMARYSAGTRGEAVIDGDGSSASGASEASGAVIDVNYSVERINNVEYVTNAEFQRGMTAAAKQGAELGRKQVYGDLINKRSVRSRLSI